MNALPAITPAQARLPKTYEAAREALATCQNIDECKDWADKAAALASYAKQADALPDPERRLPSGWWLVPSVICGGAIYGLLIWAVLG